MLANKNLQHDLVHQTYAKSLLIKSVGTYENKSNFCQNGKHTLLTHWLIKIKSANFVAENQ